ncbi:3-hydroxyethyl bacteriochlorophyllide a dehydrogenase [Natronocella acetinitrilica]|uniref:3-hydroxyethyl bacteriochlorophyllide a dehydrogenase n=2 Tax=Natronocella acetinitrilica TaxID=414046 RepID=A0AAE3G6U4_9GAMM|nr:3-hydroxyethyl bacteriochlorophyllide a dehydrogenase [Natronocella acetinitrilica]
MTMQAEMTLEPTPPAAQLGHAVAVVFSGPEQLNVQKLALDAATDEDVVVDVHWSGISTGTERLLWTGRMPQFPGMGYPLVPGYETVGRVAQAGRSSGHQVGSLVFVPGARCFGDVRGLFGGAASRLVAPGARVRRVPSDLGEQAALLALAATAWHAVDIAVPELIVGHGVLGRLVARVATLRGESPPTVWESDAGRRVGASGYTVVSPDSDGCRGYRTICDVSGDSRLLDSLIARLAPGGEIVLAGFYSDRLSFDFPAAFMREATLRVAAEWRPSDLDAVIELVSSGELSLDGLITHRANAAQAADAYAAAFSNPACLKMILDWRGFL